MRTKRGSAALELAAGATIMIAVVAFALNICFALMSYSLNDRACRDAARAAAQGSTASEATQLANAIVRSYNTNSGVLSPIIVSSVSYQDFDGQPAADVSPFVTVVTSAFVKMPAPLELMGSKLFANSIPVKKQYTFPIVKLSVNP